MKTLLQLLSLTVCFSCLLPLPSTALAQSKVEIDEDVQVLFLNKWHDGVVVDKQKKQILVEFLWMSSTKQEVVTREQVRRMNEVEAVDYSRGWESSGGDFKIDAAMKDFFNGKVTLIKEDLEEIKVPLERFCARDIAYVNKFKKRNDALVARGVAAAATPKLPELENFNSGFNSMSTFAIGLSNEIKPLGKIPDFLTEFKQSGMGFTMTRKQQELVAVIPVGGPEQLVLMTAREDNHWGTKFQSQVYWVSLKSKKVVGTVHLTAGCFPIDYDPQRRLLLTFHRKESRNDDSPPDNYTLWNLEAGKSEAIPTVRWEGKGMSWASHLFAKIVNERVVVAKTNRQTYEAWDVVEKKSLYEIKTKSFFDAPIVISPDRKHLIFPEDKQVSVIDASTGELAFGAFVDDRHVSGANINPDGTKLAALTERNIYVWDLASGSKEPTVYPAPLMGSPFSSRVEWIDDDHILGQSSFNRILYRLSLKLPIWSYEMDVRDYFLNRDPLKNMVVNGKFFYVAKPDPFSNAIAVGAVDLPGPGVAEVTQNIDQSTLMIMKPGVHIALEADDVSDPSKVKKWLSEKIESNEWVIDSNAEIVLEAKMGVGETQTVEYEEMGSLGRGDTTSATFKPHFANLKIKKGNTIIWQGGTSTGAPPFLHGENVQSELNKYQNPQLGFFEHIKIDKTIIDPKFSRGFGVSKLGLRGIEVVSTSPPGREDNPADASTQADEDEKKAYEDRQNDADKSGAGDQSNSFGGDDQ